LKCPVCGHELEPPAVEAVLDDLSFSSFSFWRSLFLAGPRECHELGKKLKDSIAVVAAAKDSIDKSGLSGRSSKGGDFYGSLVSCAPTLASPPSGRGGEDGLISTLAFTFRTLGQAVQQQDELLNIVQKYNERKQEFDSAFMSHSPVVLTNVKRGVDVLARPGVTARLPGELGSLANLATAYLCDGVQLLGSFLRVVDIVVEAVDKSIWYRQQLEPELESLCKASRLLAPQSHRLYETLAQQIDQVLAGSPAGTNGPLLSAAIERHHRSQTRFKDCCDQLAAKADAIEPHQRTGLGLLNLPFIRHH
jgi:hypothetical protein